MARYSVNSKGRTFIRGKNVGESLRANVIDDMVAEGGDPASGYFAGEYSKLLIDTESRARSFRNYGELFAKLGLIYPKKRIPETLLTSSQRMWK